MLQGCMLSPDSAPTLPAKKRSVYPPVNQVGHRPANVRSWKELLNAVQRLVVGVPCKDDKSMVPPFHNFWLFLAMAKGSLHPFLTGILGGIILDHLTSNPTSHKLLPKTPWPSARGLCKATWFEGRTFSSPTAYSRSRKRKHSRVPGTFLPAWSLETSSGVFPVESVASFHGVRCRLPWPGGKRSR